MVMAIAIARRTYHVHEDVADHEHRDLVVLPGDVELLEELQLPDSRWQCHDLIAVEMQRRQLGTHALLEYVEHHLHR